MAGQPQDPNHVPQLLLQLPQSASSDKQAYRDVKHPRSAPPPPSLPEYLVQRQDVEVGKLSNDEILRLCHASINVKSVLGGLPVYWITPTIVVKQIHGVAMGEAQTQQWAYEHADPDIVRVPKIHRYFEVPELGSQNGYKNGYIAMDLTPGPLLSSLDLTGPEGQAAIAKTIKAVKHLRSLPRPEGQGPGPLGKGEPKGPMWSDDGAEVVFGTVQDMQDWMNIRLKRYERCGGGSTRRLDLSKEELTFHHMDFARRNVVFNDGTITLLDWGSAGFYPAAFEKRTMQNLALGPEPQDKIWFNALLDGLDFRTTLNEEELALLTVPACVNTGHHFPTNRVSATPPPLTLRDLENVEDSPMVRTLRENMENKDPDQSAGQDRGVTSNWRNMKAETMKVR